MSDEFEEFARAVREDLVPKMRASEAVAQLVPDGDPDVKIAVELGMAILLDKPIVLLVLPGRGVPDHLARAADAIVEWDGHSPDAADRVAAAIRRIVQREEA